MKLQKTIKPDNSFPFPTEVSLKLVIEKWRNNASPEDLSLIKINQTIRENPFLLEPIKDIAKLKQHQDFLNLLFEPIFPKEEWSTIDMQAFFPPYNHDNYIAGTTAFKRMYHEEEVQISQMHRLMKDYQIDSRFLYAYKAILKKFYGLKLKVNLPLSFSSYNSKTGLRRYFKLIGNTQFQEVINLAPLPKLDKNGLQKILDQHFDLESWIRILPPKIFLFRGMVLTSLMDVTNEESTNNLQITLLNRKNDEGDGWFEYSEQEIRNLFRLPELRLGIASLQVDGNLNFTSKRPLWNSLLIKDLSAKDQKEIENSFYNEVIREGKTIIIENLADKNESKVAQILLNKGYQNLLLTPLYYNEKIIGILELANPSPGAINGLSLFKIKQITPILANALKRNRDEFENKVEAVLLEKFTNIHPSIQWRFRESAINFLDNNIPDAPIVFDKLFPFYCSLDIRDSSKKRNQAIRLDLLDNLEAAHNLLNTAFDSVSLTIIEELVFRISQNIEKSRTLFTTEDEIRLVEFIVKKINPVVAHLGTSYPELATLTKKYMKEINNDSGIFNHHRFAYDQALSRLNTCITSSLVEEETEMQKIAPCFVEKYQTDGVEFNIYLGRSIAPQRIYSDLYIDNIRLRQLKWTCKIMHKVRQLDTYPQRSLQLESGSELLTENPAHLKNVELEIAPLILAYGSFITLKFRMDEKRLDVDGAYNVRYEIVKKRIDKSIIKNTKERLTQPGYIAIVYMHEAEAIAYRSHFEYLANQGYIETDFEDLELEPLQGVQGLKALRVNVKNRV